MGTKFASVNGDYALCRWLDNNYGKVEIITIVKADPMVPYKVFYREINNMTNDTKES